MYWADPWLTEQQVVEIGISVYGKIIPKRDWSDSQGSTHPLGGKVQVGIGALATEQALSLLISVDPR